MQGTEKPPRADLQAYITNKKGLSSLLENSVCVILRKRIAVFCIRSKKRNYNKVVEK